MILPDARPARRAVVVTTKDRRDELAGLLPTVLAQSAPLDVLVLDDGSTDGTPSWCGASSRRCASIAWSAAWD